MTEPLTDADNDLLDAIFNEGFDEKYSGCKEQHYFCSAVEGALRVAIMKRIDAARALSAAALQSGATITIDFATAEEAREVFAWLEQNMPSPQTGTLSMRAGVPPEPREAEWLRRLLRWCRPRLKHPSYQWWLDKYLAAGPSEAPKDEPPIVRAR